MMMMKLTHDDRKSDLAKLLRNAATILKQISVHSQSKRSTPKDVRRDAMVVKKLLASARIASGGQYANELSQLEGHVDKIAQWPDNSQAGKIAAQLAARIASISGHMTDPWAGDTARATQNGGIKMNTIKQKMNYHAREYRRLKAMDDNDAEISEVNKTYRRCYAQVVNMEKYYNNALNAKTEVIFRLGKLQDFAKKSNDPKLKTLAQQHYDEMMKKYSAVERKYR